MHPTGRYGGLVIGRDSLLGLGGRALLGISLPLLAQPGFGVTELWA